MIKPCSISLLILSGLFFLSACGTKTEPSNGGDEASTAQAKQDTPTQTAQTAPSASPDASKVAATNRPAPSDPNPAVIPAPKAAEPTGTSVTCEDAGGCDCGETKCPMNGVCTDGVCKCGDTLVDSSYTGYACWEIAKGIYDIGCTESDGCPCGKIKVYSNMGCSGTFGTCAGSPVPGRGLSCRHKPYKDKYYSLGCFKDECDCYGETIHKDDICPPLVCTNGFKATPQGCTCDGRKYEEGYICVPGKDKRLINYCTAPDGCACGEEKTCARGTVCRKGECVDRYTLHVLPEGFELVNGLPTCKDEATCICSNKKGKIKTCKLDQVCLNNYCYNNPNFRKFDDIAYYYHIDATDDTTRDRVWNLLFVDEPLPICNLFEHIKEKGSEKDICADASLREKTVADLMMHCGTAPIPDDVKALFCTLGMDQDSLTFSGWHK
ncbi:MAG: hypothetical protein IIY06_09230 [Proteobacteria bacterium]|nr:hypothetical protein [Pseudomonadota bacterium]